MKNINVLSDNELVALFIEGDENSLHTLIDRHKNKIYSYIMMLVKQQELAEDIFQDTFIKVIDNLKKRKYIENGKFSSWVMRISHNLVIDHFRKKKHIREISNDAFEYDILNSTEHSESTVEDNIIYEQILSEVKKLVEYLPDNQKEVVRLRHFKGLSFKEIAEETGVSINTALGRMRYALINMRTIVEEKNISLTL